MEFKLELRPSPRLPGNFHSAAFSPDGKMLAFGYCETIRLWNAVSEKTIATFELHDGPIMSLVFSPDGQRILSTSSDQKLRIWDVASRSSLAVLDGHTDRVLSVAYSLDGNTIASGSKDNTIRVWHATSHTEIALMEGHTGDVNSVAFSPDGTRIVSGSSDNSVRIWDTTSGSSLTVLSVHSGEVSSVAYSPDNKSIASGSRDNTICVTNVESGDSRSYKAHDDWVCSIRYSPHSKWVISGGRDHSIRLWDAISGTLLGKSEVEGPVDFVGFSPNNLRIVSGIDGQCINVWDVVDPAFEEMASQNCSGEDAMWHLSSQPAMVSRPLTTPIPDTSPPLFALIVGINQYTSASVTNLKGAVADSQCVEQWLIEDLNVPRSQMQILHDTEATRQAILQAFRNLKDDKRIKFGDPIFIFYAGHGGEREAPPGWGDPGEKVQMIIPHDFGTRENGKEVQGIPDRTLGTILTQLAEAKGDNVTVMFDCCHSGSGTRDTNQNNRMPRVITIPIDIPSELDRDIWGDPKSGSRGTKVASGFTYSGLRSHVLLAACASSELAKEENGRGVFTQSALQVITTVGAHKLTYTDVIQRIPAISWQNPQCEGLNGRRILFNSRAPSKGRVFHSVSQIGKTIVIPAGIANGVTPGAEFAVYGSPTGPRLGTLIVQDSTAFSSTAVVSSNNPNFRLPESALAVQTKAGMEEDLRIAVSMNPQLIGAFQKIVDEMENIGPPRRNILLVDKDKAELEIDLEGDYIVFNICDPSVRQYGLEKLPFRLHPKHNDISSVISAAAHYYWHLRLEPPQQSLGDKIQFQFSQVEQVGGSPDPFFEPIGPNLNCGGVIDLITHQDDTYGFTITNNSAFALYPSLFFFDSTNLSIRLIYQPPPTFGRNADEGALMPNSSLAIGYDSNNSDQFRYSLEDGLDVGVGFLKLFLTRQPVDYSNIPQTSPFDKGYRNWVHPKITSVWETRTIAMVLRRPTKPFVLPEGTYFIKNITGASLEILEEYPEDGALLTNTRRHNRLWTLKKGTRGYTFRSVTHGTYLYSSGKQDGTVQTARVHGSPNGSEWEVVQISDNYQILLATDTSLALDLLGSQNLNGIPVIAWPDDDGPNQQWIFEPVPPGDPRLQVAREGL